MLLFQYEIYSLYNLNLSQRHNSEQIAQPLDANHFRLYLGLVWGVVRRSAICCGCLSMLLLILGVLDSSSFSLYSYVRNGLVVFFFELVGFYSSIYCAVVTGFAQSTCACAKQHCSNQKHISENAKLKFLERVQVRHWNTSYLLYDVKYNRNLT